MNLSEHFLIILSLVKYVLSDMEGYIMNGKIAKIKTFPYQVFLDIIVEMEYMCGGSILNQATILTAAHCLHHGQFTIKNVKVLAFYGAEELQDMSVVTVKTYKTPERYNDHTLFADLGVVRCNTPIALGTVAKRVAIMLNPPSTTLAYVAGWGVMNNNDIVSTRLLFTPQQIQPQHICGSLDLPDGAFCAGLPQRRYPSIGDSGGPLVINEFIQVGLVSYKIRDNSLVAYTNVSYFINWIKKQARDIYCYQKTGKKVKR